MNKEVIYLEPDDDITDILTKLQRAEQKLVALVPPKKATMLRSAVNMKLVARAAKECEKVAVIVTADPAIVKLAMAAQIPVAKTLQSRPVVPTPEMVKDAEKSEQVIDEDLADNNSEKAELDSLKGKKASAKTAGEASNSPSERVSGKGADTIDLTEESLENGSKDGKKANQKGAKVKDGKKVPNFDKYRKWIILGVAAALILIVFGVWAFVFAPAVKITVAMSTSSSNFSEEVHFTTDSNAENLDASVLFLQKETLESTYSDSFEASGKEDRGERAEGTVNVTLRANFMTSDYKDTGYSFSLAKGTRLTATTADGKSVSYLTDEDSAKIEWDGTSSGLVSLGCRDIDSCTTTKSTTVKVHAISAGEEFNIGAGRQWNTITDGDNSATITNSSAFTGGSSREVTTVTQSNIDGAKERILSSHSAEGRSNLLSQVKSDKVVIIESSFASEVAEVKSTPELNAEVDSNVKPEITVKIVYSVYVLNKETIDKYVNQKFSVSEDQRIYSVANPYIERFSSLEEPARLKAIVKTGPTVTKEDILAKAKGRKIGEVQSLLRSINGVSSVTIDPSYFWVWSVPKDDNKVEVELTVEDN